MKAMGHPRQFRTRRASGFTAIEITAVATIIAILALILIPIMRNRVEEAKVVAAKDDMQSIEKAMTLSFADTGKYVRIQDLTRPRADPEIVGNPAAAGYALEIARVPQAVWNRELFESEIPAMARTWTGVQISIHRFELIQRIEEAQPYLFSNGVQTGGGPILFFDPDDIDNAAAAGLGAIRYPTDPWGNPYIFFGPGQATDRAVEDGTLRGLKPNYSVPETNFSTAIVYSLGPDGRPGFATDVTNPLDYFRQTGALGADGSDDISREF
jgi:general secretion pathway protein G